MITLQFAYRGQPICLVAPDGGDAIPQIIEQSGSFYELDVLERCEHYVRHLQRPERRGVILDVGAYIGNHSVFFARFCPVDRVIAFEASKPAFDALTQTIRCNNLTHVSAYNVAVGGRHDWGAVTVSDPRNLGANRLERRSGDARDAVRITPLDAFLESISATPITVSLMKIDVEGMESDVIEGAKRTLAHSRPVLCIEILDVAQMRKIIRALRGSSYLIREVSGAAPTYLLTWESRVPRFLVRAINYGWLVLTRVAGASTRWRYRRLIEVLLPV